MENSVNRPQVKGSAIVVGGSSGIGYETCVRLSNRGWNVINVSRSPCKINKVKNINCDVAAGNALPDAVEACAEQGAVNTLVYSAGFSMAAPIEHARESDYRYLFEVNYFGAVKAVQAVVPHMRAHGGKIILVGSLGGRLPIVFDSFYSSSKAALEMFAFAASAELQPYNISVSAVLPGGTSTNFTFKRKVYPDDENGGYCQKVNKAVAALANIEQSGTAPSLVAEEIYKIIISDKPPIVRTVGIKNSLYGYAGAAMPKKLTLYMTERMFNQ